MIFAPFVRAHLCILGFNILSQLYVDIVKYALYCGFHSVLIALLYYNIMESIEFYVTIIIYEISYTCLQETILCALYAAPYDYN